jgi:hypothetical protein
MVVVVESVNITSKFGSNARFGCTSPSLATKVETSRLAYTNVELELSREEFMHFCVELDSP